VQTLDTDIAIIGGGIAGLWCLNQLRARGYSALLFEREALGSCQTIGSQGMIHGGVKYALSGAWQGGSRAIAAMPAAWRECLAGRGEVDLRGCRVLSEGLYLWSSAALPSRLTAFFASRLLRGRVMRVGRKDYPAPLRHPRFRGQVYRLADPVLDVPSLLATLASRHREAIFRIDWRSARLERAAGRAALALGQCTVRPERLLLSAGSGNEALLQALGADAPAMQRRPLQQVLVRHQYPESFFAHCMGPNPSPRLTVSSHRTGAGAPVWYLGGDLATAGAEDEPAVLIGKARRELAHLLPWLDLGHTEWRTVRLDRAEPLLSGPRQAGPRQAGPRQAGPPRRPESAFVAPVAGVDNALVTWPTKLSLCPDLGNELLRQLAAAGIRPRHRTDLVPLAGLGRPAVASPYWETLFP
jgi:glycerol-3-phosphate dehydrogenase